MNLSTVRQTLCTALRLRAAWADAQCFEYPAGSNVTKASRLELTDWTLVNEDSGYRGEDEATFQLNGVITSQSAGATDAQWRTAEDAVFDLLIDLRLYLRTREAAFGTATIGGTVNHARLTVGSGSAAQDDSGIVFFRLPFTLEILMLT